MSDQNRLRARALRASAWILLSKPIGMALQLARSLILTRLLLPEAFGLMALVGVIMQGLVMCSDVGIGPNIIQSKRGDDPSFLQTAWTLQIVRGVALWTICCLLAWPASVFYGEPRLFSLLPIAALSVLINGFASTAGPCHQRQMKLGRFQILAFASGAINLIVVSLLALALRNVWALVIGSLIANLLGIYLGFRFLPGVSHRFRWDNSAARELVKFGKWVFASTLLTFLAMQMDRLMLGKLIPIAVLGVYGIAMVLSNLPRELVNRLAVWILFPALSEKFRTVPEARESVVLRTRGLLLRLALMLTLGVFAIAPAFFAFLYDPRYHEASWMAQALAVSTWFTILYGTTGHTLLALGDSRALTVANLVNLILTVIAALLGFRYFGLSGFILGYAVGTAAGEVSQGILLRRHSVGVVWQDIKYTATFLGAIFTVHGITWFLREQSYILQPWSETAIGLCCWAVVAVAIAPAMVRESFSGEKLPRLFQRRKDATSTVGR